MRDLYNAFGLLAGNPALRLDVTEACGFVNRPDLKLSKKMSPFDFDFVWEVQPNPANLESIRLKFNAKGVFLSAYELAEINRLLARPELCTAIDTVGTNLRSKMPNNQWDDRRILLAVGALMVDKTFRAAFLAGGEQLTTGEFGLTQAEETQLVTLFQLNDVMSAADDVGDGGWQGTTCLVAVRAYPGMISFNA